MKKITSLAITGIMLATAATTVFGQAAADTYKAKCQMCHGATGMADSPAGKAMGAHPFNSPAVMKESQADLIGVIKAGKGKMPSYTGKLTDGQIKDLAAYVITLEKK